MDLGKCMVSNYNQLSSSSKQDDSGEEDSTVFRIQQTENNPRQFSRNSSQELFPTISGPVTATSFRNLNENTIATPTEPYTIGSVGSCEVTVRFKSRSLALPPSKVSSDSTDMTSEDIIVQADDISASTTSLRNSKRSGNSFQKGSSVRRFITFANSAEGNLPESLIQNDPYDMNTPFYQVLASLQRIKSDITNSLTNVNNHLMISRDSENNLASILQPFLIHADREVNLTYDELLKMEPTQSAKKMAKENFKSVVLRHMSADFDGTNAGEQVNDFLLRTFLSSTDDESECSPCLRRSAPTAGLEDDAMLTQRSVVVAPGESVKENITKTRFKHSAALNYANRSLNEIANVCKFSADAQLNKALKQDEDIETAHIIMAPTENQTQLTNLLETEINQWDFPIFELDSLTNGWPLSTIVYQILQKRGLLTNLHIPNAPMFHYLLCVERLYRLDNPYHNRIHGADVAHAVHIMFYAKNLRDNFSEHEIFATLMGATCHDLNHPGLTTHFLLKTYSDLAILYNDQSVLENHHASCAFTLLLQPEHIDIFKNFSEKDFRHYRKTFIMVILATDMSKHIQHVTNFRTLLASNDLKLADTSSRNQILQIMVHCADISNPTKSFSMCMEWKLRIQEEFHIQGDIERNDGLKISPMCDRHKTCLEKSQICFLDLVARPLWELWCELVAPDGELMLDNLLQNYATFKTLYSDKKEEHSSFMNSKDAANEFPFSYT